MRNCATLILALGVTGCVTPYNDSLFPVDEPFRKREMSAHLVPGQTINQGMIGASFLSGLERNGGEDPPKAGDSSYPETFPLIAGAVQTALGGEGLNYGFEIGASLGFQTGEGFVAVSGNQGLIVAVDIDLLLVDLFGGPFISVPLTDRARLYVGAGPLVQFGSYSHEELEGESNEISGHGTGLGFGWNARAGAEIAVGGTMMLGFGARWLDSRIGLSDGLGTLDVVGTQVFVSISTGF
ncbi:MAG: hypothetical protein ACI8X5_003969 [Planctomycetota bacterium]|jgi:hypothetical protein